MAEWSQLKEIRPGMSLVLGGDRVVEVPREIAETFAAGDAILPIESTGEILHVPAAERQVASNAVGRAAAAFAQMGAVTDAQISKFFEEFASRLENDAIWSQIQTANDEDVEDARLRGRSTTRLVADEKLRRGMIDGLRGWIDAPSRRGSVVETIEHDGWKVDLVGAELGIVAFVFEGRPNVLADATGVLRGGNAVVFRIGRDALGTARAIMDLALDPSLASAGLPAGAACLVDSPAHAAGWALFSDSRISLAVARGSGPAVATLGGLARQAGIAASLHGTGGAWIMASESADNASFRAAIRNSLDRKVCNTLNVCCVPASRADELVPAFIESMKQAGERRGQSYKIHVVEGDQRYVPEDLFQTQISVRRAQGDVPEPQAELLPESDLGLEWEWEETPEVTLKIVADIDEAIGLFNQYSPQFIASLVSLDAAEHERFYGAVNAPFVGNGFTRWVDGQYALKRPELGLSNWQNGRLFGRGAVLSGDSVYTVRGRVTQSNPDIGR